MYDFRKYQLRSVHAETEEERKAINQELKDIYANLDEANQKLFNEELQVFLMKQYKTLGDDYQAIKDTGAFN